jgi:hypothetical protein
MSDDAGSSRFFSQIAHRFRDAEDNCRVALRCAGRIVSFSGMIGGNPIMSGTPRL